MQEERQKNRRIVDGRPIIEQLPDHHRKVGQDEVRHRAGQRREGHALLRVFEVAGVGGDRLCPAHAREHHAERSQQIEVAEGDQRQSPLLLGCGVAQQPCGQRVARLVERDDGQGGQHPCEGIKHSWGHGVLLFSIRYTHLLYYFFRL